MSEYDPPYALQKGSVQHPADVFRQMLASTLGGVEGVAGDQDMKVVQDSPASMTVTVLPGSAFVLGDLRPFQGMYHVVNQTPTDITLDSPHASLTRIDLIVARIRDSVEDGGTNDDWIVDKVTGTPASFPIPPDMPDTCLGLSEANVKPAPNNSVAQADLLDIRDSAGASSPVGMLGAFARDTIPLGWMPCFGQALSRSVFARLFAAIGVLWGPGNGSTTFNAPDLRDCTLVGLDNMGGTARNVIPALEVVGAKTGEATHQLVVGEMPKHKHGPGTLATDEDGVHYHTYGNGAVDTEDTNFRVPFQHFSATFSEGTTGVHADIVSKMTFTVMDKSGGHQHAVNAGFTDLAGSDTAHNNVQPSAGVIICVKI